MFYFITLTLAYLMIISELFNTAVARDISRLIINIVAVWFIVYKTKEDYLYFSIGLCFLVIYLYICYVLEIFGLYSLYAWDDIPVRELTGNRFFGQWSRVTLSDGPKSGSILYFGIFMYFLFAKYHLTNKHEKNLVRIGLSFSFLLFLFTQTISGYIIFLVSMIHYFLTRIKFRRNSIPPFLIAWSMLVGTVTLFSAVYIFSIGSARTIIQNLLNDFLRIITDSIIIGKGYGFTLYSSDRSFNTLNSDYSFYVILIYEIGFLASIIISITFLTLKKNNYILYFYLAIASMAMHTTSQLIYSCFIIIFGINLIEYKKIINHRWSTKMQLNNS
mgnify:CR=1 FL=1